MRSDAAPTISVRVAARHALAQGIAGFELATLDGQPLPWHGAGAHIDVHTPCGLVRPYSLCRAHDPGQPYRIAVLREASGRGGSASMHNDVKAGDVLRIGLPRNLFVLDEHASHSLLLAGGIGITPMLAMAERLAALKRPFALHHASRTRAHAAFADELQGGPLAPHTRLHHDDEAKGPMDLAGLLREAPGGTHVYVCGPAGFIRAARHAADALTWPETHWHVEAFSAGEPTKDKGADDAQSSIGTPQDGPFEITLARSDRTLQVGATQTIVDALAAHGIRANVSCEQGLCGTCETRVLAGRIVHRDFHYSAQEQAAQDRMLICCSRAPASSRLVLDL